MSYMTTVSKIHFNPLEPNKDDILIEDIAHALSFMARANGHFKEFYSVANHSILCAKEAKARGYSQKLVLACLLHDASEAYMSDVTRPVKKYLPEYLVIEEKLQNTIYEVLMGSILTQEEQALVKCVDDLLLHHEFLYYMDEIIPADDTTLYSEPIFKFQPFEEVKQQFISLFNELKIE